MTFTDFMIISFKCDIMHNYIFKYPILSTAII